MVKNIFLICAASASCFATSIALGESIDVENEKELFDLILTNKDFCTDAIIEGKIYLKPEKIESTDEGPFLWIDHFSLIKLPDLHSDESGRYIIML